MVVFGWNHGESVMDVGFVSLLKIVKRLLQSDMQSRETFPWTQNSLAGDQDCPILSSSLTLKISSISHLMF